MTTFDPEDLMTDDEREALDEFEEMVAEPATTQEFADKVPELTELLKKVPTDAELKRRAEQRGGAE